VDGADFFAVYEATREALELARQGGGPTALEADIIRFSGHFIGDPQLYRGEGEIAQLRKNRDCLKHFRARVTGEGWLQEAQLDAIDTEVAELIERAVEEAMASPMPAVSELTTDVYCSY